GALEAQLEFETAAIGGKDSMSGSFENLHVPPTLISFACAVGELKNIISPEIKSEENYLYLAEHVPNADGCANYTQLNAMYTDIHQRIVKGEIISAQIVKDGGLAAAVFKMAVGNGIGAVIQ
ncbi:MAG TPA: phosphoribosylformylglycinamidine synthase, partial [Bacteroidetes bacterium]|nr:phosphoribosylformylglycinamidine synthase [Bacteroidota bacterium]